MPADIDENQKMYRLLVSLIYGRYLNSMIKYYIKLIILFNIHDIITILDKTRHFNN